jgi:MoxR-like ATPase
MTDTSQYKATYKQARAIWAFCVKNGNKNTDWSALAKNGVLKRREASEIITAFYAPNKNFERAAELIRAFIPDFELKPEDERTSDVPDDEEIPKEDAESDEPEKEKSEDRDEPQKSEPDGEEDTHGEEASQDGSSPEAKLDWEKLLKAILDRDLDSVKELLGIKDEPTPAPPPGFPMIPEAPVVGEYIKPKCYDEIYHLVRSRVNVLLTGPAGCGKSRMAEEIAKGLEVDFHAISFSGGMRYAQVFGTTQLKDGESEWKPAELLEAIQKPGVILLDEVFAGDPDVLLGVNSMLEPNSRKILTPIGEIAVHDECRFIGAANTSGRTISRQYTGAQRSDDSLLDRFVQENVDYEPKTERKILEKLGVEMTTAELLAEKLRDLREKIKSSNIPFDASTRRLISAARIKLSGIDTQRAFSLAFLNGLSKAERAKVGM